MNIDHDYIRIFKVRIAEALAQAVAIEILTTRFNVGQARTDDTDSNAIEVMVVNDDQVRSLMEFCAICMLNPYAMTELPPLPVLSDLEAA